MKFLMFGMFDTAKAVEVAQAADKVAKTPGQKTIATYVCQGIPFHGVPEHKTVVINIVEAESNEAITATQYPLGLAGVSVWAVPVLEVPVASAAAEAKKYTK